MVVADSTPSLRSFTYTYLLFIFILLCCCPNYYFYLFCTVNGEVSALARKLCLLFSLLLPFVTGEFFFDTVGASLFYKKISYACNIRRCSSYKLTYNHPPKQIYAFNGKLISSNGEIVPTITGGVVALMLMSSLSFIVKLLPPIS